MDILIIGLQVIVALSILNVWLIQKKNQPNGAEETLILLLKNLKSMDFRYGCAI